MLCTVFTFGHEDDVAPTTQTALQKRGGAWLSQQILGGLRMRDTAN